MKMLHLMHYVPTDTKASEKLTSLLTNKSILKDLRRLSLLSDIFNGIIP